MPRSLDFDLISVYTDASNADRGNVAAVIALEAEWSKEAMQRIASDFNQPATTFLWPAETANHYHARWFAPDAEIGLCGHGSAAAAAWSALRKKGNEITLIAGDQSITGRANAAQSRMDIVLDAIPVLEELKEGEMLSEAIGAQVLKHFRTGNKNILLLKDEKTLRDLKIQYHKLRELEHFGYAITAPADGDLHFVSRTIVPFVQQLEDHGTGSSHAALVPFWSERLGIKEMKARQLSQRGARFECKLITQTDEAAASRVQLSGQYGHLARGSYVVRE